MSDSEETLKQNNEILQAIADLSKKFDDMKKEYDAQFEAIRVGVVHFDARFDRLEGQFLIFRGDLKELTEEVKQGKKSLV